MNHKDPHVALQALTVSKLTLLSIIYAFISHYLRILFTHSLVPSSENVRLLAGLSPVHLQWAVACDKVTLDHLFYFIFYVCDIITMQVSRK